MCRTGKRSFPVPCGHSGRESTTDNIRLQLSQEGLSDTVRIFGLEIPGISTHLVNAIFSLPAEFGIGFGGISIESGQIAGTSFADHIIQRVTACFFKGMDDVEYAVTDTVTDVVGFDTGGAEDLGDRTQILMVIR